MRELETNIARLATSQVKTKKFKHERKHVKVRTLLRKEGGNKAGLDPSLQ